MSRRILVAGVGNIFLGDDGFGVEVARRLAGGALPEGVTVEDFGIRGIHLAYQLLDGYDALILIDAVARGGAPGTLYVIEPDLDAVQSTSPADAHGLDPEVVLGMVKQLGGQIGCVRIIGCDVAEIVERMGLSEAVEHAVSDAVCLVHQVLNTLEGAPPSAPGVKGGGTSPNPGADGAAPSKATNEHNRREA